MTKDQGRFCWQIAKLMAHSFFVPGPISRKKFKSVIVDALLPEVRKAHPWLCATMFHVEWAFCLVPSAVWFGWLILLLFLDD